jgi:cytidylate kinase
MLNRVVFLKNFFSKTLKFWLKLPIKITVKRERTRETISMQAQRTDAEG